VRRAEFNQDILVLQTVIEEAPAVDHAKQLQAMENISEYCAQACPVLPEVMAMYSRTAGKS